MISSANNLIVLTSCVMYVIHIRQKSKGSRTDPCGTPHATGRSSELNLPVAVNCVRSDKYLSIR
jgi:hypothetical protein